MRGGGTYLLIFGLVALALSAVFAVNLFLQSKTDLLDASGPQRSFQPGGPEPESSGWTRFITRQDPIKDYYPADEIMLSWDLVEADEKRDTLYKVTFDDLDRYQYFCLAQVLDNHDVKRSIQKVGDRYTIYLSLYSPQAASVLMDELKEYDIYGSMSPYKSEIKYTP